MRKNKPLDLRSIVYIALFTTLIIIGGYICIPIPFSPVPIALGDFFVLLAGFFLGASGGLSSVALFIFLGILGLPVFAGGKSGLAVLVGPTSGFIYGYLACAFIVGLISTKGKPSIIRDLLALLSGFILLFAFGVIGIKLVLALSWPKALAAGLIPFIPGNIIKAIAALIIVKAFRSKFRLKLHPSQSNITEE